MRRTFKTKELTIDPTKTFQEYSFLPRNHTKTFPMQHLIEYEKNILTILENVENKNIQTIILGVVTCENTNIKEIAQNKNSYEKMIQLVISNKNIKKIFFSNTKEIRKIACETALKTAFTKVQNNRPQSFMVFDVEKTGQLICRGGASVSLTDDQTNIDVFLDTNLCKNFELTKTSQNNNSFSRK